MKTTFWSKLNKPFFCLAPMADVTDAAFRQIIAKYGKPDVFWTEFVSADGLAHPKAREKLLIDFKYSESEHPIVAQIFGANPENIRTSATIAHSLGFDGVDINMGCPDRSVEKQGAGAALIKNPKLALEIIRAAREGAPNLPISVKTRIGYNKDEIETWFSELLKENLAALTVHLRTRKEMSDVPAHWELMPKILELRNKISPATLIIGNGGVKDLADAKEKAERYGCDGVMLGSAIFGNPWLFSDGKRTDLKNSKRSVLEESENSLPINPDNPSMGSGLINAGMRLRVMVEHTKLFEKLFLGIKSFAVMKKHYKAYTKGIDGKELRMKLMEAKDANEVEKITLEFISAQDQ